MSRSRVLVSDTKKGFELLGNRGGINVLKEARYKDLFSSSRNIFSIKITPTTSNKELVKLVKIKGSSGVGQSTLFNKQVDLTKLPKDAYFTYYQQKPQSSSIIKAIQRGEQTRVSSDINKVINSIKNTQGSKDIFSSSASGIPNSEFYGKGMYERTDAVGGFMPFPQSPTTTISLQQQLKTAVVPDFKLTGMGAISNVKLDITPDLVSNVKLDITNALVFGQVSSSILQLKLSSQLKQDMDLRNLLKENMEFRMDFKEGTKVRTKTPTDLKTIIQTKIDVIPDFSLRPTYRTPTTRKPYIPPIILKIISPERAIKQMKIARRRKTPEGYGLLPDFTARAIGLKPKEVSVKDALKELKKLQTGFGIRTGIKIKGYKPIDEKKLMMGIMK